MTTLCLLALAFGLGLSACGCQLCLFGLLLCSCYTYCLCCALGVDSNLNCFIDMASKEDDYGLVLSYSRFSGQFS